MSAKKAKGMVSKRSKSIKLQARGHKLDFLELWAKSASSKWRVVCKGVVRKGVDGRPEDRTYDYTQRSSKHMGINDSKSNTSPMNILSSRPVKEKIDDLINSYDSTPTSPPSAPLATINHLLHQLTTIRATINHLRSTATPATTTATPTTTAPSDLLLYSHISPIGSACHRHPDLLHRYMNYTPTLSRPPTYPRRILLLMRRHPSSPPCFASPPSHTFENPFRAPPFRDSLVSDRPKTHEIDLSVELTKSAAVRRAMSLWSFARSGPSTANPSGFASEHPLTS
ncbi:hypothetical protein Scep_014142 [Stephania cephalantha]|uniref:Uncharacterized protein n=1 Tax=Stephania cephalantha TaxID=152367 RepID=A0AAP0J389_9MAGN